MLRSTLKATLPVLAACIFFVSCSSSKKTAGLPTRDDVKGNWVLNDISYDGLSSNEKVKITLLDEGGDECFKGSTWSFPNNGNGNYNITAVNGSCTAGQRNIVWSHRFDGDQAILQFKRLPGGVKAKDVPDGYKFKILSATDATLTLQSEVAYNGKPIFIRYEFSKP